MKRQWLVNSLTKAGTKDGGVGKSLTIWVASWMGSTASARSDGPITRPLGHPRSLEPFF